MNLDRRMVGRELPCSLAEVLGIEVETEEGNAREEGGAHRGVSAGWGHLRRGEWGLARRCFGEAMVDGPGAVSARVGMALACEGIGQHDAAAAQIDGVLAVWDSVREGDGDEELGLIGEGGRGRWAVPTLHRYGLLCGAGVEWERAGEWKRAKARYVSALAARDAREARDAEGAEGRGAGEWFALHRLVAIHLAHGEVREAVACLVEVVNGRPGDSGARVLLGHLLRQEGRHSEAVWEYQQAICLQPETWEMEHEFGGGGCAAIGAGAGGHQDHPEHVVRALEQLAVAQPQFPDLRMRLGNLYSRMGEDEQARAAYLEALAMHPEYLDCHLALARHERGMGRFGEAAGHLRRALNINEQNCEIYAALALSLKGSGAEKEAREMLGSAARISLSSARLANQIDLLSGEHAELWASEGEEVEGWIGELERRYEEVVKDRPGEVEGRLRLAMMQRLMGRSEEACRTLGEAVKVDEESREAWVMCGLALAEIGNEAFAFDAVERGLYVGGRGLECCYRLGLIYCGNLEFDLAMERVEELDAEGGRKIEAVIEGMEMRGMSAGRSAEVVEVEEEG